MYNIKNKTISTHLNYLNDILKEKYEIKDFVQIYTHVKIKKCIFFVKEKNKNCNKKIKNNENDMCNIHIKINKMLINLCDKNKDIHDFTLEKYNDKYYKDILNNIFEIKEEKLIHVGIIDSDTVILF